MSQKDACGSRSSVSFDTGIHTKPAIWCQQRREKMPPPLRRGIEGVQIQDDYIAKALPGLYQGRLCGSPELDHFFGTVPLLPVDPRLGAESQ